MEFCNLDIVKTIIAKSFITLSADRMHKHMVGNQCFTNTISSLKINKA